MNTRPRLVRCCAVVLQSGVTGTPLCKDNLLSEQQYLCFRNFCRCSRKRGGGGVPQVAALLPYCGSTKCESCLLTCGGGSHGSRLEGE